MKKAMILAAGEGRRMCSDLPKPLHQVSGLCLIEHRILALAASGIEEIIINLHHKADAIQRRIGDGAKYGIKITYSIETTLLKTGGGIVKALPLLGDAPFILVNADVWTDFDFNTLQLSQGSLAHLVLVDNPKHNPQGDFCLHDNQKLSEVCQQKLTFSGVSLMTAKFFEGCPEGAFSLGAWLNTQMAKGLLSGEHHQGLWIDVGTQKRLVQAQDVALNDKNFKKAAGHDIGG